MKLIKQALAVTTNIQDALDRDTITRGEAFFKFTNIGEMVSRVVTVSLTVSALMVLLFIVWGAIDLISSQGDKQQYEGARNKITYALVGLAIVAAAWAAWAVALQFFGIGEVNENTGTVVLPEPEI